MPDEEQDWLSEALGAAEPASTEVLTLFIPSADQKGKPLPDQANWVSRAAELLAEIGGGVTIMPPVDGGWLAPNGKIVWEKPILVYTYIRPDDFEKRLPQLRSLLHSMGRETNQGEIAVLFGDQFYRIRDYDSKEAK